MTRLRLAKTLLVAGLAAVSGYVLSGGMFMIPDSPALPPPGPHFYVDLTRFTRTFRDVRLLEFRQDPAAFRGQRVRLCGFAIRGKDERGRTHHGLKVFDRGGCCPLFIIEYLPARTNAPPVDGERVLVDGDVLCPAPKEAFSAAVVSNATVTTLNTFAF